MRKITGVLLFILLLTACAAAEIKILPGKDNELPFYLEDAVRNIPEFPRMEYIDNHLVISGLKEWGANEKALGVYKFDGYNFFHDTREKSDDQLIIYGTKKEISTALPFIKNLTFSNGKLNGWISIRLKYNNETQDELIITVKEKKKNGISVHVRSDGDVWVHRGDNKIAGQYRDGILVSGTYDYTAKNLRTHYQFVSCGQKDGENLFEIDYLTVDKKSGNRWDYIDNYWDPQSGWENPEDKTIAAVLLEKYPFSVCSSEESCRILPAVSVAPAAVAENISGLDSTIFSQPRIFRTLLEMGLPALPDYTLEETGSGTIIHYTGLARWGFEEDEADRPLESPNIHTNLGKLKIALTLDKIDNMLSIRITQTDSGAQMMYGMSSYPKYTHVTIPNLSGTKCYSYAFCHGYLESYGIHTADSFRYYPEYIISPSTVAEDLKPAFSLEEYKNDKGTWRLQTGEGIWAEVIDESPLPEGAIDNPPSPLEY